MDMPTKFLNSQLSEKSAEVRDQIIRFLRNRGRSAFSKIEVEAADGVVTLRGNTRSFYERQIALTQSQLLIGDCLLIDEIVVL